MGYSCTAIAGFTQDAMLEILQAAGPCPKNTSNGWIAKGKYFFCERGREHNDGSITGTVWGPSEKGEGFVHNVGGYRITAEGKVARWPTSTAAQRLMAEQEGAKVFQETFYRAAGLAVK
jgi:hypothetical protein